MSQNNETAVMLVSQTRLSPGVGVELFSYANAFICTNKFTWMLATPVKTFYKPVSVFSGSILEKICRDKRNFSGVRITRASPYLAGFHCMPTPQMQHKSSCLPDGSPNLPIKIDFRTFQYLSLDLSPILPANFKIFRFHYTVSAAFACISSLSGLISFLVIKSDFCWSVPHVRLLK